MAFKIDISQLDRTVGTTGSQNITGSLTVNGQTILRQLEPTVPALIVSGSLEIENLGTISNKNNNKILDLGEI
jgi:hypothetical protein